MRSIFYKKGFLTVFLALVMVSLSCGLPLKAVPATQGAPPQATDTPEQPTSSPEPTQEIAPTVASQPQAEFGGVTFFYDPQISSSVAGEDVAALDPGQGAPWEVAPAMIKFSFDGYPVADSFTAPVILVFPVKDYQNMSPEAYKIMDELRKALGVQSTSIANGLPFLPMWNAAQMMRTKIAYFNFSNGSGVRYLTQYGQAPAPINNNYLFYTYQGLTSDDNYYISAILPVTNAMLPPDSSTVPDGDYQAFSDNFLNYITAMQDKLDVQPEDAFVPSLTLLDDMIKSIAISR
jgi:hypothetical protein